MRFHVLALVLLPAAGHATIAEYTITLHNRTAEARARFPKAPENSVTFALQSWAATHFYNDIEGVAASDFHGNPMAVEPKADGEWVVQNHRRPFELRWRVKATKAQVLKVKQLSNAERAGICPGDSLESFSVYTGDTNKEAKFGLLRGAERINITYLPVRTQRVAQVDGALEMLR